MLICALLISFICILMLLILSLHQERTDRNLASRDEIKTFMEMKSHYWKQ